MTQIHFIFLFVLVIVLDMVLQLSVLVGINDCVFIRSVFMRLKRVPVLEERLGVICCIFVPYHTVGFT